jgi:hypothetical protein
MTMNFTSESYYLSLHEKNFKEFELMKNTMDGILLQFNKPVKYDLTIPRFSHLKILMIMWADYFRGVQFLPEKVNCCNPFGYYQDKNELDILKDSPGIPERIKKGMIHSFNRKNKNDVFPLEEYLQTNEDLFGFEEGLYRFREGKRKKIFREVKNYFNKRELKSFNNFGNFVKPYIRNLGNPYKIGY